LKEADMARIEAVVFSVTLAMSALITFVTIPLA